MTVNVKKYNVMIVGSYIPLLKDIYDKKEVKMLKTMTISVLSGQCWLVCIQNLAIPIASHTTKTMNLNFRN